MYQVDVLIQGFPGRAVCHGGRATAGGCAGGRNAGLQRSGGQSWWWWLIARAKQLGIDLFGFGPA